MINKTELVDFNNFEMNDRGYGGNAGTKLGIVYDNENWLLKFPKSTKSFESVEMSYTTAPLSEYIGSHIYELLGIPVHETLLGIKDDKIVVACKDFLKNGDILSEFKTFKNMYNKEIAPILDQELSSGSGDGTNLDIVLMIIEKNRILSSMPNIKERFWDMFVVDALINNNDRNNGNWGIIKHIDGTRELTPVYDNGNAFSNKSDVNKIERIMASEERLAHASYITTFCAYEDDKGKKINPCNYILTVKNDDCNQAVKRICAKLDLEKVNKLLDSIPETYKNKEVLNTTYKEFIKKTLKIRKELVLDKALEKILLKEKDIGGIKNRINNAQKIVSSKKETVIKDINIKNKTR